MNRYIFNKRLERIIRIIEIKLSDLPQNPFGSDYIFYYPDEWENQLPDAELQSLIDTVELNFKNNEGERFNEMLHRYISSQKLKSRELYISAMIEKSYFYQIRNGKYLPLRDVTIRLCFALKLNLDESKEFLHSLGYAFYDRNRRDIIIMECIKHRTKLYAAEVLLNKYDELSLCSKAILADNEQSKPQ